VRRIPNVTIAQAVRFELACILKQARLRIRLTAIRNGYLREPLPDEGSANALIR
jgi:hypothetical protein